LAPAVKLGEKGDAKAKTEAPKAQQRGFNKEWQGRDHRRAFCCQ
jgi:hypothetical protein